MDPDSKKILLCSIAILFLILVPLILTLCLKGFGKKNNSNSSEVDPMQEAAKTDEAFKYIVNKGIQDAGLTGSIEHIEVLTFVETYPKNFSIKLSAYNSTTSKVYLYEVDKYVYPTDKEGYDNFVSYLLLSDNYKTVNIESTVSEYDMIDELVTTSKENSKFVTFRDASSINYISGYYFENNCYHIAYKTQIEDGVDPFLDTGDAVGSQSPLYNYYQYLNQ